ncbi:MAG: hypothetical protein IPH04_01615 [Saprospirales bacterium]|nr:hypothetical protein [Saprospirales bacterium]
MRKDFLVGTATNLKDSIIAVMSFMKILKEGTQTLINARMSIPWRKAVFDTRQGPFDIYSLKPVLQVSRGFLLSMRMKKIILEYPLPTM